MHHALSIVMFLVLFVGPCVLASSFEHRERREADPGQQE